MEGCVFKPPCFTFLIAGMRLSLSSGPFTASMALTIYTRTLDNMFLLLGVTMPSDDRPSIQPGMQALMLLDPMVSAQDHAFGLGARLEGGQQGMRRRAMVAHPEFGLQGSRYVALLVTGRA